MEHELQLSVFGDSEMWCFVQLLLSWKDRILSSSCTVAVATGVADNQPLSPGAGNWIYISGVEHLSESSQSIPIFYNHMTIENPLRLTICIHSSYIDVRTRLQYLYGQLK